MSVITNVLVPHALIGARQGWDGRTVPDGMIGDLLMDHGHVVGMRPAASDDPPRLVMPRLTEAHVHLDKCHTVDRLGPVGGNLRDAINAQFEDKANWTAKDLRHRAGRGVQELIRAGVRNARSHVDWNREDAQPPLAWHVLLDLAAETQDRLHLQLSPLIGVEALAEPSTATGIAKLTSGAGGALGCFVYDQPRRAEGIRQAFRAADRFGVPLDFHVDEGMDPGLDGLEIIADTALETGFEGPVLCGHACSLMNLSGDALAHLIDKIARAGLHIVALPSTNLYLQGRGSGTPDRRGLTRVKELQAAGVNVIVGTDNVRDAFCPVGQHDPLAALSLAVLAGHLDPPLERHLPMITTGACRALGLPPLTVQGAAISDLLIFDVPSVSEVLAGSAHPRSLTQVQLEPLA